MSETIWENTLDERYKCTVTRNSQYSGQLKILDENLNKILCDEEVRLSYGAAFGPDVDDLNFWKDRIISVVDNTPDPEVIADWLDTSPITEEKNEELGNIKEEWENARKDALEHKKNNEYWKFLVSTWWEQGCGRTIFLCMTQATPEGRDFDRDGENPYVPINTQEERAIRKFKEIFGEYFTQDVKFITREEFFTKYAQYLPPKLLELKDELCNIDYHSKFHFNFS